MGFLDDEAAAQDATLRRNAAARAGTGREVYDAVDELASEYAKVATQRSFACETNRESLPGGSGWSIWLVYDYDSHRNNDLGAPDGRWGLSSWNQARAAGITSPHTGSFRS